MNSSSFGSDIAHQENVAVRNNVHLGHTSHQTSMAPAISRYFNHQLTPVSLPTQPQAAQLQLETIRETGNGGSHITRNSAASVVASELYDPHQIQLTNGLEKTFFNTSATGLQPSTQRFYNSVTPNVTTSPSTNPIQQVPQNQNHSNQQGNTILITNNYAAHQYGAPAHNGSETSALMQSGTATNVPPGVTAPGSGYHSNATGNIRIISTLPDPINHQQQQQNVYNLSKELNPNVRDDIQLPQFYHAAHQSSTYPQQLSTMLPTHFTQTFTTPSVATASMHIAQDGIQQQHQYFMAMTNNNDSIVSPSTAALTSVPKVISNITGDVAAVNDAITTPSSMISSPATTATSNSTLVLDRINICINNHYSDSLTSNNSLSNTSLDANGTSTNSVITSAAHTFTTAAHTPQQPSPIIPAIHHKVILEPVGSSISGGTLQTDPYTSNDSSLVIDEPDSTTTTPHTPPTTPENSSPPPPASNLASTRTRVAPQETPTQIIIEDTAVNDEENYIIPSIKQLEAKVIDKTETIPPVHAFTTITQSINLLDDDESDYANSEKENEKEPTTIIISNAANDDSIMEIEDDDVIELSTPETIRMDNNIKCGDGETPNVVSHAHNVAELDTKRTKTDSKAPKTADSPQSPTHTKVVEILADETASSVTLLTPPTPTTSPSSIKGPLITEISFSMGEDVFIRRDDGRQYLGTVIGSSAGGGRNMLQKVQYLIRFDDNSEMWCGSDQMRRFGSISGNGNGQMCVACKRTQLQDVVEICDDCRRGYHRSCTRETLPGSGVWWCLRCSKPMKDQPNMGNNKIGRPLTTYKNSYKAFGDITKGTSSSSKLKTPADVYEFHTDNEVFTSDDEIPIKHIMEKARKTRESTQNSSTNNMKQKSIKKQNNSDGVLCDQIMDLDDQNANDANSINKITQSPKSEKAKEHVESSQSVATKASKSVSTVEKNNIESVGKERTSRKRKAFTLSNTYKEVAAEAASKRYDSSRICDSSSDENSSSSRGTSLDVIIPPPKNFLGLNNPFRMLTPKKSSPPSHTGGSVQSLLNFYCSGTMIKNSIFNTTALDFSSKLAALKSAGIFPNISTSNLAKAAGQPRTVRTIKRRLSAKDITIGPNQEVRRRRTRRLSSNIEVISTTTINPIATNFFPIHAKDLLSTHAQFTAQTSTSRLLSTISKQQQTQHQQRQKTSQQQQISACGSSLSSASSSPPGSVASSTDLQNDVIPTIKPSHGRRLRQRPQKNSPGNSRRSSMSSASTTSSTNSSSNITLATLQQQQQQQQTIHTTNNNINVSTDSTSIHDLKQSVKEYFGGAINRIESGEQFCIRAKRQLANGQMQYLIEWGDVATTGSTPTQTITSTMTSPSKCTNASLENDN